LAKLDKKIIKEGAFVIMMRFDRIHITPDAKSRLKKFAALRGLKLYEALEYIISSSIDEEGKEKVPILDERSLERLLRVSKIIRRNPNETLNMMIETIYLLFDEEVTLAEVLVQYLRSRKLERVL